MKLLPDHYTPVTEPHFEGRGNHNVLQLEAICEQYKEFAHQSQITQQELLRVFEDLEDCFTQGSPNLTYVKARIQGVLKEFYPRYSH